MTTAVVPGIYVTEHKTTGADIGPGSPYWKRLTLDSQVSNYMVGARALGHEPIGVLYDVVRKVRLELLVATPAEKREYTKPKDRACKECKKGKSAGPHVEIVGEGDEAREVACIDGRIVTDPGGKLYANLREHDETLEEYRLRVRADIAANPDKYFQRGLIVRLAQEEEDAATDVWTIAEQIRESRNRAARSLERATKRAAKEGTTLDAARTHAIVAGAWRRNLDTCNSYGEFCEYWAVCTRETTIDDPTRYRDAKEHEELEDDGKRRLPVLSTSSGRAFGSCPRKYFYAYEMRRRAISATRALRFGTIFHIGLEVWWTTVDLERALAAMRAAYAKHEIDPVEAVRAEELMLGYHVLWKNEPLTVVAVESEFSAPLVNPETGAESKTWQRGGKIDAIVRVEVQPSVARCDAVDVANDATAA